MLTRTACTARDLGSQIRIALERVGDKPEGPDNRLGVHVLARVADRDAIRARIAVRLHVAGDGARLRGPGRDQVIGMDDGQPLHLLGRGVDDTVVDEP